jgi:hypothetical protein
MTQYNAPYPGYPGGMPPAYSPQSQLAPQQRRFPFFMGYVLWFSPSLWRDAGKRWRGIGFWYMLILVAISWGICMAVWYPKVVAFGRDEVPKLAEKIPPIHIKDGVASADVPQPYFVNDPDTGKAVFVIDTTGEITQPPEVPSVLMTKTELIVRDRNKTQTLPLKEMPAMDIDKASLQAGFDKLRSLYWPLYLPIAVVLSMLLRLIQMLILGLIAMAVGSSQRPPLTFAGGMRLSAIALTPIIIVDTLLWAFMVPVGCVWFVVGIILQIVLLVFMAKSCDEGGGAMPGGMPVTQPGGYYVPTGAYPPPGYAPPAPQAYGAPPPPPSA